MQIQKILIRRLMFKILILAVTAIAMPFAVAAQQAAITLPVRELAAYEVFDVIKKQTEYKFVVNTSSFDARRHKVTITQPQMSVTAVLDKLFEGSGMTYAIEDKFIVVPIRLDTAPVAVNRPAKTPSKGSLLGIITNSYTKETVADVVVQLAGTNYQATTDRSGRFVLNEVKAGSYAARLTIPQFDTVVYRDMLVRAGTTTQVDINLKLTHASGEKPQDIPALPVAGVPTARKKERASDARHTYLLVESGDNLSLPRPRVALKTNLLYYAATTPNIGLEFGVASRWSVDVAVGCNPGKFDRNDGSLRHWYIQPEGRYWFRGTFERHFIGVNGLAWQFDMNDKKMGLIKDFRGKRYEGYGIGAGLSYGYHLPVASRWALEFGVGVGYLYMDYRDYGNSKSTSYTRGSDHYFGPTKATLALMFMIK